MKIVTALCLVAAVVSLAACANSTATNAAGIANREAEASGSPFRWETKSVGGGTIMFLVMVDLPSAPTAADPLLKNDTLALIAKAEASKGRSNPEIEDIKRLKDGREVWILKSDRDGIAYIVAFRPAPQGGVDIEISGPKEYQKGRG